MTRDGDTISEATLEERKQATSGPAMERVTFRLPRQLREAIDNAVERGRYASRSEALRAAVRERFVATDGSGRQGVKRDRAEPPRRSRDNYAAALARVYRALNEAHLVAPHPEGREFVNGLTEQVRGELQVELRDAGEEGED